MILTPNLGLRAWDLGDDPYDHSQLANNFTAIDRHDHAPGRGVQIGQQGLANGAIVNSKLASNAVTSDKVLDRTLTGNDIAVGALTGENIQDGSIGTNDLADESITFAKLSPNVVPYGQVITWYRPRSDIPVPGGWEIMDGRPWSEITNVWGQQAGNIPDMRNKFVLGSSTIGPFGSLPNNTPDIGQVGGSHTADLSHQHNIAAHSHVVDSHSHTVSSHAHGMEHRHTFINPVFSYNGKPGVFHPASSTYGTLVKSDVANAGYTEYDLKQASFSETLTFAGIATAPTHNEKYADNSFASYFYGGNPDPFFGNLGSETFPTVRRFTIQTSGPISESGGPNGVGVATQSASPGTNSASPGTNLVPLITDGALGVPLDKRPVHVGLLFLMRVR